MRAISLTVMMLLSPVSMVIGGLVPVPDPAAAATDVLSDLMGGSDPGPSATGDGNVTVIGSGPSPDVIIDSAVDPTGSNIVVNVDQPAPDAGASDAAGTITVPKVDTVLDVRGPKVDTVLDVRGPRVDTVLDVRGPSVDPVTDPVIDPVPDTVLRTGAGDVPSLDRPGSGTPHLVDVEGPIITELQRALNALCARNCVTEFCYLADVNDCRNFITCDRDMGYYRATLQPCAFGTYWAGQQSEKKIICDLPGNVDCNIDYCAGKLPGETYDHLDGNCTTHWECSDTGKPLPKCCPEGKIYDSKLGACADDVDGICHDICSLKPDRCAIPGTLTDDLDDGNCRTYKNCTDPSQSLVCCPEGQGYSVEFGCVDDFNCIADCPKKPECPLKPDPNSRARFIDQVHGADLSLPCAPGTEFNYDMCGCSGIVKTPMDNSCNKELDIIFDDPIWLRAGSQNATQIKEHGHRTTGPIWNGRTSTKFDGNLYYRIPFFQSQYPELYFKIEFRPDATTTGRQVLLSNCKNLDLGAPSMELSLQNNKLVIDLVTDITRREAANTRNEHVVTASVDYTPEEWNTVTGVYNGQEVYLLNEHQGLASFAQQNLTGPISVAAEGLDFGGCYINIDKGEGYLGSFAQLEFSKCLKQEWWDEFSTRIPV